MKAATIIGIVLALVGISLGGMMEGTNLGALLNIPAILIVFGGTLGATLAACGMESTKKIPALYKKAFSPPEVDLNARVDQLVGFAEQARRDGLLALDDELTKLDDPFTKKGLQLVVDGCDPEVVREIMEAEIDGAETRAHDEAKPFEKGGGFAPTLGIIGTVMGLVHVLENLDAPETLGPAISGAFIATLWGVGMANVVFLPVASRLQGVAAQAVELDVMTLEGLLAIQAGDNPRIVGEKLTAYIPPAERRDPDDGPASRSSEGAAAADDGERLAA